MTDEAHLIGKPEPVRLRLQFCGVGAFAGNGRSHTAAGFPEDGQSIDEHIHGLHRAQLAHADDVGGIRPRTAGSNSVSAMPLRTMRTIASGGATTLR